MLTEGERKLDQQWSQRYARDVERLESERDSARQRAADLHKGLDDAITRLTRLGDHQVADLLRLLDGEADRSPLVELQRVRNDLRTYQQLRSDIQKLLERLPVDLPARADNMRLAVIASLNPRY